MIEGLFNSGSMPALERVAKFTQQRHNLLVHNIANLSTPGFRPVDLSVSAFQQQLRDAIDARRRGNSGGMPPLDIEPSLANDGVLYHDRNNRSLEHMMKDLAENTMTHNAAMDLLKNQFRMLETAISQRV